MLADYQVPAIALIAALMLAFVYLHRRFHSVRTLLWTLAIGCAELQAILLWFIDQFSATGATGPAIVWMRIASESALLFSSALFLASLSPLGFRLGRIQVLFAVPYVIPLLVYSALYFGVTQHPTGPLVWVYYSLGYLAAAIAFIWSLQKGAIPIWLAITVVGTAVLASIPLFLGGNFYWPLLLVESGNMIMTALLVIFTYRRLSPGVALASCGFLAWALPPFFLTKLPGQAQWIGITLAQTLNLGKVVVAMGLILLVLEDELEKKQRARQRELRVRTELEAYARQTLSARSLEEFDRDSSQLCNMIVEFSRFSGAAMIVRNGIGLYTLVGYAGMDRATAGALDALAQRLPSSTFKEDATPLVAETTSIDLDLFPWLTPGDDLERLRLTRVVAIPMLGPDDSAEGALLLSGLTVPIDTLRPDDLLPLEILAGRLQAARAQAMMLGKLIDSERFAGVGQLATNVAQQLNNPLTVILGYSTLLEESLQPGTPDRRGADAIAAEARRMKTILERLSRFSRLTTERYSSFSVADLVTDIEQLHRTDFLRNSIEFRLSIEDQLPEIFGNPHQIRQALLHAVHFAIDSATRVSPNQEKSVRIEATVPASDEARVRILVGHSGQGFPHPDRAFDSLAAGFSGHDSSGIGLSLCAAIVREHRGTISAVNLQPSGAAILLDLPIS